MASFTANLTGGSGVAVPGFNGGSSIVTDGAGNGFDSGGSGGIVTTTAATNNFEIDITYEFTGTPTGDNLGLKLCFEGDANNSGNCYLLAFKNDGFTGYVAYKFAPGGFVQLSGNWNTTPGFIKALRTPTTVSFVDSGGTVRLGPYTYDSTIPTTGKVGLIDGTAQTATNHYGMSAFSFHDVASAATSYTASIVGGNALTQGVAATINLAANGTSTAVVTPTIAGVSPTTTSPTTQTLNGTTTVTVTYTPTTTGSGTISFANGGGLTNPSSISITVSPPAMTLGVNSTARLGSPGNWIGDTGRGGTVSRTTWVNGAWATYAWSTTAGSPTATFLLANATAGSQITYFINGAMYDGISVPTSGGISISGVTTGSNVLTYYTRNSAQSGRWAETNAYVDTGLIVDGSSTAGTAPSARPWVLIVGDSITEGINSDFGSPAFFTSYTFGMLAGLSALGYDTCVSACGFSGWIQPGDSTGDVPGYYSVVSGTYNAGNSRWNKIDSTHSLLDSASQISSYGATGTTPAAIVVDYGVNEALNSISTSDMGLSIQGWLAAARAAAPSAWLFIVIPPGLYNTTIYANGPTYVTAIKTAVTAYQTANPSDTKVYQIDLGASVSNALASTTYGAAIHWNALGHAYVAPQILQAVVKKLSGGGIGSSSVTSHHGQIPRGR